MLYRIKLNPGKTGLVYGV